MVTSAGAVLIDSGASFRSARKIHEAAKKATSQPVQWVINTGDQDHRWPGTNLVTAQAHTRDLLLALRAHMKKAVDDGVDLGAAVKSFDAKPFAGLKHADV